MQLWKSGVSSPELVIDISRLPLNRIETPASGVGIGALACMNDEIRLESFFRGRHPSPGHAVIYARAGLRSMSERSPRFARTAWLGTVAFACAVAPTAAKNNAQNGADQGSLPPTLESNEREALDDAWWTGPIFAASAATLPQGHFLIEPVFYDSISYGSYDNRWAEHASPHTNAIRSFTFLMYGVTDTFMAGLLPKFGYDQVSGSARSGLGAGDTTIRLQYRLVQSQEGRPMPGLSFVLDETFPTGKYQELGASPGDGLGTGAFKTTASVYSQYYFWIGDGRILRARLDVAYGFTDTQIKVKNVSVYGTRAGFRGSVSPGNTFVADIACEYSLTRNWVPALDVIYERDGSTELRRFDSALSPSALFSAGAETLSGSGNAISLAPALEYNWNKHVGVIVGVAVTVAARNASATITPVLGVNMAY